MCGVSGIFGKGWHPRELAAMVAVQAHRGPDGHGFYLDPSGGAGLGHNRLKIIDLSDAGRQPMANHDGRLRIAFNGEIYNYRELRAELGDYPYRSHSDTEVILAAYERWGDACVERLIGMFAFLLWDERERRLLAVRDRFGVKPLNYHVRPDGTLIIASEIRALFAAGQDPEPEPKSWSTYLTFGLQDHSAATFWQDVQSVPAGHLLTWQDQRITLSRWYNLEERVGQQLDDRPLDVVQEEYTALLVDSVRLRFRADVPVGINLSGGLDSSMLLALVHQVQGRDSDIAAFTFTTGDPRYDELPWVRQMLEHTRHPCVVCQLDAADVPVLAASVSAHQDEPFGGIPSLAYAQLFDRARSQGTVVLLDGQGMDEQWAGYDYFSSSAGARVDSPIQGTTDRATRPECLDAAFRDLAEPLAAVQLFPDRLRHLQIRDTRWTKIPRALRFNDRLSMRASTELREPFLDHRLMELALRQPADRKHQGTVRKWLPRRIAHRLLPAGVVEAPKRPVQTPQREWLRAELRDWASAQIDAAITGWGSPWLNAAAIRGAWAEYCDGTGDNSFYVWQWIGLGLLSQAYSEQRDPVESVRSRGLEVASSYPAAKG